MLVVPDLPPNHGTVLVSFGEERSLADCSMLHGEPLRLDENAQTRVEHGAWGVRCSRRDGRWHVWWRALHKHDGFECRFERFGASDGEYQSLHEQTRGWSPFNYEVTARLNCGDRVNGVSFGQALSLESDGSVRAGPGLSRRARARAHRGNRPERGNRVAAPRGHAHPAGAVVQVRAGRDLISPGSRILTNAATVGGQGPRRPRLSLSRERWRGTNGPPRGVSLMNGWTAPPMRGASS